MLHYGAFRACIQGQQALSVLATQSCKMQGKSQCNQLASYSKQVFPALQLKDVKDLMSCQGLAVLLGQCYQNLYCLSIAQCRNHRKERENFLPLTSRSFLSCKSSSGSPNK